MVVWRFLGCVGLMVVLAGCSKEGPDVVPVKGKLTRNGQPVPKLTVIFQPDNGRVSLGQADEEGNFELEYDQNQKGARVGGHTVSVVRRASNSDEELKMRSGKFKTHPDTQKILAKYGPEGSDQLKVTITADQGPLELKLD